MVRDASIDLKYGLFQVDDGENWKRLVLMLPKDATEMFDTTVL